MPLKTPALVLLLIAAGYAATPCLALYQLHLALRSGNHRAVNRMVDWSSVRAGLDEEIADVATDVPDPRAVSSGTQLAPFGFGFVRGIASRAADSEITAPKLLASLHSGEKQDSYAVRLAYFTSPWEFVVQLVAAHRREIRIRLNLEGGVWRVTRVWVPPSVIREAAEHPAVEAALN
ncbi:MAG: DUF2939 domain-containing protein [Acetobacteraceae bacterium]|nr:DUF2939 domain-containing protein [Acetobacteraceae bacterium]